MASARLALRQQKEPAGIGTCVRPVVHLHTHTTYSPRDGLARLGPLLKAAADDGQPALAVTDHGNLSAAWKFAKLARSAGIKPIVGIEAYLAHGSRLERCSELASDDGALSSGDEDEDKASSQKTTKYHHLTLLAATKEGWRNLATLSTDANDDEAFWSKPRMDMGLLAEHSAGLVVLTGCIGGPVASPLSMGDHERAERNLRSLLDIFGKDRLFVEVMDHAIPGERKVTGGLVELARRHGLAVVATNDAHYVHPDESEAHDAWLCNGSSSTLSDPSRWRFQGQGYWLRTSQEMRSLFDDQPGTEQAVNATLAVADIIEDDVLPDKRVRLPSVGPDADKVLEHLIKVGAKKHYGNPLPPTVKQRLRHEYDVITKAGLSDYFLIVADMIHWARSNGIRVGQGRGSAAGSTVAYCLDIVQVDPIRYDLLFERFLAPDRAGLPDIDTDFEQAGTARVIDYLARRWGSDKVARIGTTTLVRSKAGLISAARVLELQDVGSTLSALVPTGAGGQPLSFRELDQGTEQTEPFRKAVAKRQDAQNVVKMARTFEGQVGTYGIHACGIVVSSEALRGLVPLHRDRRQGRGELVTDWDAKDVEDVGLVKLDVLGLRNLDIVSATISSIKAATGETVVPEELPEDMSHPRAAAAWKLIASGDTAGVFQLEGSGMTDLAGKLVPQSVAELSDLIALYRPGPLGDNMHILYVERKSGAAPVDYTRFTDEPDEALMIERVLHTTFGVPVYQEQIMGLGEIVAGFSPSTKDKLRKAVAKKEQAEMAAMGLRFIEGAQSSRDELGNEKLAFKRATAEKLWASIKTAGAYAFNKSHSLGYAKLAYVTAYLKANWPTHFAVGMLVNTTDKSRRLAMFHSVMAQGVQVRTPDVNASSVRTTARDGDVILLGLSEVDGVGEQAARAIVAERESHGPFVSLADIGRRVVVHNSNGAPQKLSTAVLVALVEAGACDAFGPRYGQCAIARCTAPVPVPDIEWGPLEKAARERRRLGVVLSSRPLVDLGAQINKWRSDGHCNGVPTPVHKIRGNGAYVLTIGVLAQFSAVLKGHPRHELVLDGSYASIDGVAWQRSFKGVMPEGLKVGEIVAVLGTAGTHATKSEDHEGAGDSDGPSSDERVRLKVTRLWRIPVEEGIVVSLAPQPVPGPGCLIGAV